MFRPGADDQRVHEAATKRFEFHGAVGRREGNGCVRILLVQHGPGREAFLGQRISAPQISMPAIRKGGNSAVNEFRDAIGAVFQKHRHETVAAVAMKKAHSPEISAVLRINVTDMKPAIATHPQRVREGMSGEDPFIIAQGAHVQILHGRHPADFQKPRQTRIEAVFHVDVQPGR